MNRHSIWWLSLCAVASGCQSYEPLALDLDAYEQAWADRDPGGDEVARYIARLDALNGPASPEFDASDGLTLEEAERVALVFNPSLRVARLKARVPALGAAEAGRWDDPELELDLQRIVESVDDPWVFGAALRFTVPISGRLDVQRDKAMARADVERRRAHLAEWELLTELRHAWAAWTAATQRVELTETYLSGVDGVLRLAEVQRRFNRIGVTELRVLQLEHVTQLGRLEVLRADARRQQLAIKALMGMTPQAEFTLRPSLSARQPDLADARVVMRESNLQLAVARAEFEVADHDLRLQIQKQYPDLVIGPSYEDDEGVSKVGVVLSVPIPLLNQNRRAIAEARAERDAAKAVFEAQYETLVADMAQARARVDAARDERAYLETKVAPLADQQIADLRRLAELGDLDVSVMLDALTRTYDNKLQVLDARVREADAANELRALLHPIATPTGEPAEAPNNDKE